MMNIMRAGVLILVLSLSLVAACGSKSSDGPAPPTLSSIAVTPANLTIPAGTSQQFAATGTYSDGSMQNITTLVTWASSNRGAATVNGTGLATAVNPGNSTTISATAGAVTGSTTLSVQPLLTKAVVKIASTGSLDSGTRIGGITVTVVLPSGVTIKAIPDTQNPSIFVTDPGIVTASGAAGAYAAAFATVDQAGRNVHIQVYNQNGFDIGEFVTVTCDIVPGTALSAGDFGLEGFTAKDLDGADIIGLTAGLTVDLQ